MAEFPDSPPGNVQKCAACECFEEMDKLNKRQEELDAAQDDLQLAAATYDPNAPLPANYHRASVDELKALRLHDGTNSLLQIPDTDFHSEVFVHTDPDSGAQSYTIGFRGTQTGTDWKHNISQGRGKGSAYYAQAAEIARRAESAAPGQVSYTGHSLGGGLASAAAGVNGSPARTFNAAGLHESTIAEYGGNHDDVEAYYLTSDPLNWNQDYWSRMPEAVGNRHGYDKVHDWTEEDMAPVRAWEQRDYAWYQAPKQAADRVAAEGEAQVNRAKRFHGTDELSEAIAQEQAAIDAEKQALKDGACKDFM